MSLFRIQVYGIFLYYIVDKNEGSICKKEHIFVILHSGSHTATCQTVLVNDSIHSQVRST